MDKLTDADFLGIVRRERQQSVGFEHDAVLTADRTRALEYSKGVMKDMIVPEDSRSKATSSDIADAIETVLPDLVEIFIGDDVATFQALSQEDEDRAQLETDYINHVFFNENPGFTVLYSAFKDALQLKTGIFKWGWTKREPKEVKHVKKPAIALGMVQGKVQDITRADGQDYDPQTAQPHDLLSFTEVQQQHGMPWVKAVAPEDFTVSADTVTVKEAPYCAHRSRPRAQELIEEGIDADIVSKLPAYGTPSDMETQARDTAGESQQAHASDGHNLHQVEVVEHYIRVDADGDGKTELWKVRTGNDEGVLIDREEVSCIPLATVTPYMVPHRLYGESIADKLMEIQRIKTALTRIALDSGYFALNQRHEINMDRTTEDTVDDYLANEPGRPIRSHGEALSAVEAGQLNFDPYAALEYHSVQGEQRTGVVRNAQGLNPDTLHDTAGGALALMGMAQKRTRFIARVFAETGVKDLFLGLHALMREQSGQDDDEDYPTQPRTAKLGGKWVSDIDPSSWCERTDMNIEIGVGSGGAMHDLAVLEKIIALQTQAVMEQGGLQGPFVTGENLFNAVKRYCQRAGQKNPEAYFTDPTNAPPAQPRPDPKMAEVQGKLQLQQATTQAQQQMEMAKAQQAAAHSTAQLQIDAAHKQATAQTDLELNAAKMAQEAQLKREEMAMTAQLRREEMAMEADLKRQALEHAHTAKMAQVNLAGLSANGHRQQVTEELP